MDDNFNKTWRYKAGLGLFIIGNVILLAGILLPMTGLGSAGLISVFVVGGEIISLSSIVFLGKGGFKTLKQKLFGAAKTGFYKPVSPVRHYVGIALFCFNAVAMYLIVGYAVAAFDAASMETPVATVWGMDLSQQRELVLVLFLVGEISFIVSLYLLGADWWEKFRNLFVWSKPDHLPGESQS